MNTRADAVGVTMENVVKKYGQTTALRDFGLVVEPGEMIVLLGPSGCGKTTALRCPGRSRVGQWRADPCR